MMTMVEGHSLVRPHKWEPHCVDLESYIVVVVVAVAVVLNWRMHSVMMIDVTKTQAIEVGSNIDSSYNGKDSNIVGCSSGL